MMQEEGTTQEQYDNIKLTLSEQIKQSFYKHLKDTNAYEQWRSNIHRELEENLQRQVEEVLEETERQERLAKLRRQYLRLHFYGPSLLKTRTGQRYPSQSPEKVREGDPLNEIDRRNQRVLYPLNAKESYGAQSHHSSLNYHKNKLSSHSFNLESYHKFCRRTLLSQRNDENLLDNSETSFQNKRTLLTSNNNSSPFLYGNSILKTNKADILNFIEQQSNIDESSNIYINKHGIIISEYGPFWPRSFRILHPTPKLLSRELTPKEFYLTVTNSLLSSKRMRIGQSIWSREDFNLNNPTSSLLFSTSTSNSLLKFQSDTELSENFQITHQDSQEEFLLPHGHLINSSKKLFSNKLARNRIYEPHQCISENGIIKTIYYFRATRIVVDDTGPFWPMAFPIRYPTPSFLSLTRNDKKHHFKEYYCSNEDHFLGRNLQQTYDNQPTIQKYTDVFKHPIIVYDMDKSPRQQQPKIFQSEQMCPSLIFESRFEGGNLRQVKRVGQFEYELVLRPDLYTRRHTQWYYFRVQNMIANITYRFRIINLVKKSSLYSEGMQILLYSDFAGKEELRGWHRAGHHINYSEYKQRTYNPLLERDINYFELDFQLEFIHSGDTCYIAHCYPYTFTDLKDDLDYLSSIRSQDIFRRDILCESQAGNSCFIVTVTDESVPISEKKFVFITARIHPGETNSSYMMRGLLEFITSDDKIAKKLRSELVFKIVPMLNPDGVIIGNYRCSLTGKDMNRNFRHPRKHTFPTIYHVKQLMQNLKKEQHEILAFCDLHGHSRKSNVFAYGCDGCDGPQPDMKSFLNARVLPYLMSRTAPEMFAFDFCKFHIDRCKESTGRVVMWKEMLIKNSLTLEASFAGTSIVKKPCHFNIQDYEKFGQCICESLKQYLDILSDSSRLDLLFWDITKNVLRKLKKEKIPTNLLPSVYPEEKSKDKPPTLSVDDCIQALEECHETLNEQEASCSSDSDSDPEGGELPDLPYRKDEQEQGQKKKSKKKRSEKIPEERILKLPRKQREENEESHGTTRDTHSTTEEFHSTQGTNDTRHRKRTSRSYESEIDTSSPLKLTLAVDQIEKTTRTVPPRSTLFTSKYANRNGHGQPIFTTERALERRQKRSNSVLHESQLERALTDDYDTDTEQNMFYSRERSQLETIASMEQIASTNQPVKRTASFVCLTLNDLPLPSVDPPISTISGTIVSPSPLFRHSSQRRLQHQQRRQSQQQPMKPTNSIEFDQIHSTSPSILTLPNFMEIATRTSPLPHLTSTITNADISMMDSANKFSYETQVDANGINHYRLHPTTDNIFRSSSKNDTSVLRSSPSMSLKIPTVSNQNNGNCKRSLSQRTNNYYPQTLSTIDSVLRERSLIIANENAHQPDAMERVNHLLKQLYLPTEKK